jgi:hypothetical protein
MKMGPTVVSEMSSVNSPRTLCKNSQNQETNSVSSLTYTTTAKTIVSGSNYIVQQQETNTVLVAQTILYNSRNQSVSSSNYNVQQQKTNTVYTVQWQKTVSEAQTIPYNSRKLIQC